MFINYCNSRITTMARNTFAIIGILAVLLLGIGMVSAASGTTTFNGITMTVDETSLTDVTTGETYDFTVTLANANGTDYNVSFGTSGWDWDKEGVTLTDVTETFTGELTIGTTLSKSVIAKFYNMSNSSQLLFQISETIDLTYLLTPGCTDPAANNTNTTEVIEDNTLCTYTVIPPSTTQTLCEYKNFAEIGNLKISDFDINVIGEGNDEEWQYLDEIKITVELENTHNSENIEDVEVRIIIMDNTIENGGNDVTSDFDLDDDTLTNIGTLKDGRSKREDVTFTIDEISPEDLDAGTYYIYVMAYEDNNEAEQCESMSDKISNDDYYFKFEIESVDDDEAVVAKGIGIDAPVNTYCGQQNLEITIPIYNLGDNDEERVLVILSDSAMGIYEYEVIRNLDSGDREDVVFFIDIPSELSKDKDDLDVEVYFNWDDDEDDENPADYDDKTSDESVRLIILSCTGPAPSVNANLASPAEVGTELIIKALITNNGDDNDFVISVSDFESWAEFVSITPQTASIKEGEFTEVTIVLKPKTAGTQSFKINTIVDGKSHDKLVSVKDIAEKKGLFSGMSDAVTYTIIAIIAVLVLIFLVLIARVSRRPAKPQF